MHNQPARQIRSMLLSSISLKMGWENSAGFEKDLRSMMWAGTAALAARSRARMLGREAMTMLIRASSDLVEMRSSRFCSVVPEPEARTARFMAQEYRISPRRARRPQRHEKHVRPMGLISRIVGVQCSDLAANVAQTLWRAPG